jgi:predicted DNA-binding transcriptional regulator AlpA
MAKKQILHFRPLSAGQFYRKGEAEIYFGCGPTKIDQMIADGEIEPPISITDTGRAVGWFGETIIAWQQRRKAAARASRKQREVV